MPELLIEILSEEIPARMQEKAAADLRRMVTDGLTEAGLTYSSARAFSAPCRLVLVVEGLPAESPPAREERRGPRVDAPERAVEGFLRGTGLTRDRLEERDGKKGRFLFAIIERPGRPAAEIAADALENTVRGFPWPKSMRWGTGTLRWIRPIHSILCILSDGAEVTAVPLEIDGIQAGDKTRGHRFMAPEYFSVTGFLDYVGRLRERKVILDAGERADRIWDSASEMARAQGLEAVGDKTLLTEVAGLVEWPVVLMGAIEEEFLDLPPEVLRTSMREHQKFFVARNPGTGRIARFIAVANIETPDGGVTILEGNRKVLAARLSDARFFWENDLRVAREEKGKPWLEALERMTFHRRLGTQAERISRIEALASEIATLVGAEPDMAALAARWAKADLPSQMVQEFPELQGKMGCHYAEKSGLPADVAVAAREHYLPLGPGTDVPSAPVSVAVALADKLDALACFWVIGERPTGSGDPFALRRAALGTIRLVLENGLRLRLSELLTSVIVQCVRIPAIKGLEAGHDKSERAYEVGESLLEFFHDRLKVHLRAEGIRHDVIDACLGMSGNDDLTLLVRRARALSAFLETDDGESLLLGFRRANNILTQAEEKDGVRYDSSAAPELAVEGPERVLFAALDQAEGTILPALDAEDMASAMSAMSALRPPIDAFFEEVLVNAEDEAIRCNRLNLLGRICEICMRVADLKRIEG